MCQHALASLNKSVICFYNILPTHNSVISYKPYLETNIFVTRYEIKYDAGFVMIINYNLLYMIRLK
jgi:hypothetical protein